MTYSKRWFHWITPALLLLPIGIVVCACSPKRSPLGSPHPVIIFDIDTLRADALGCYGADRATSPFIDAMAAEAVLFERTFSQAPNTPPSQASIFTSLYPRVHGRTRGKIPLPKAVVTLAEVLQAADFRTAAFVDGGYMAPRSGLGQGFDRYVSRPGGIKGMRSIGPAAIEWLRTHSRENFLLLIHTYDTHTPYEAPEPFAGLFTRELSTPSPGFEPTAQLMKHIMLRCRKGERNILPPADIDYARARYDECVRHVDSWIGIFFETMKELDLLDRATIVLFSDHGEEFQEHGSVLHEKLYTTVTHIPLIIRPPGGRNPLRVSPVVESIDIMPTILEMVGIEKPDNLQGHSLLPLMSGGDPPQWKNTAFGESLLRGGREYVIDDSLHALRTVQTGETELYDLDRDPTEQDDLSESRPEDLERLAGLLDNWEARCAARPKVSTDSIKLGKDEEEDLRALGYIE